MRSIDLSGALIILLGLGCLCEPQSAFDRHVWIARVTVKKRKETVVITELRVRWGFDS